MEVTVRLSGVSAAARLGGRVVRRRSRPRTVHPFRVPVLYCPGTSLGLIVAGTGGTVGCLSPPGN